MHIGIDTEKHTEGERISLPVNPIRSEIISMVMPFFACKLYVIGELRPYIGAPYGNRAQVTLALHFGHPSRCLSKIRDLCQQTLREIVEGLQCYPHGCCRSISAGFLMRPIICVLIFSSLPCFYALILHVLTCTPVLIPFFWFS